MSDNIPNKEKELKTNNMELNLNDFDDFQEAKFEEKKVEFNIGKKSKKWNIFWLKRCSRFGQFIYKWE